MSLNPALSLPPIDIIMDPTNIVTLSKSYEFDEKNFPIWKMKMQAYLEASDLFEAVTDQVEMKPVGPVTPDVQIKINRARKVYSLLISTLKNEQVQLVLGVTSGDAFTVWKK